MKYSIKEFAQLIRDKYPGDYDDLSDEKLISLWLKKYPGDQGKIELGTHEQKPGMVSNNSANAKSPSSSNPLATIGNLLLVALSIFVIFALYLDLAKNKNIFEYLGFKKPNGIKSQSNTVKNTPAENSGTTQYKSDTQTSGTYTCSNCNGGGSTIGCTCCYGKGVKQCMNCHGTGYLNNGSTCLDCKGRGFNDCNHCFGAPKTVEEKCIQCWGNGKVEHLVCEYCGGKEIKEGEQHYSSFAKGTHCFLCDGKGFQEKAISE